jgi:hypothetical protein
MDKTIKINQALNKERETGDNPMYKCKRCGQTGGVKDFTLTKEWCPVIEYDYFPRNVNYTYSLTDKELIEMLEDKQRKNLPCIYHKEPDEIAQLIIEAQIKK